MPALSPDSWLAHLRECAQSACLLEATARKAGNVHPQASFADLNFEHFQNAANVLGPIVAQAREIGVGETVLRSVHAVKQVSPTNANLGIILLLAPLAAVPPGETLGVGIDSVLKQLTLEDARLVYEAIRLARPGGLGRVEREDVSDNPTVTLLEAMRLAASRDTIALQYDCGFADILNFGLGRLIDSSDFERDWERSIIRLQLEFLSLRSDSLIARKCGLPIAEEASQRARALLEAGWSHADGSAERLQQFDQWLRADGNRRNPGTTADLIAASLFAAFRERLLQIPKWARLRE